MFGGPDDGRFYDRILDNCVNAASARTKSKLVELWLTDTGCAHDLASLSDVTHCGHKLQPLVDNVKFQTANGGTVSTHNAPMQIIEVSERVCPYVLKETPAVLSFGDRTMNKGYTFVWPAYRNPYFIIPNGFRVDLEVIDDVPFLRRSSDLSKPTPLRTFGSSDTPRRKKQATPAADLGGIQVRAVEDAIISDDPLPPSEPDVQREAQRVARRDLKTVAKYLAHMLTHKPANPYCDACNRGKMRDAKKFHEAFKACREPTKFLELVTCDHIVSKTMEGLTGDKEVLVIKDLYSDLKELYPVKSRSLQDAAGAIQYFRGTQNIGLMYSDNSGEIIKA
eukprot:5924494-Heterocapsa_arctica.AAC.1